MKPEANCVIVQCGCDTIDPVYVLYFAWDGDVSGVAPEIKIGLIFDPEWMELMLYSVQYMILPRCNDMTRLRRIDADYYIRNWNMNRNTLACVGCDKEGIFVAAAKVRDILWLLQICHIW